MTLRLRQVLTLLLLSLFSIENVAMSILTEGNEVTLSQSHRIVSPEIQPLFLLLAEENEERDHKDETTIAYCLTEITNTSPHHLLALAAGMIQSSTEVRLQVKSLPRYSVFCSFII